MITELFSGTKYVTANLFFPKISSIRLAIRKWSTSEHVPLQKMSEEMKTKFEKYWKEVHGLMSVATVLDPRYKLHMLQALFGSLYGFEHATAEVEKIRKLMGDLLLEYQASDGGVGTSESQVGRSVSTQGGAAVDEMENIFKQYMSSKPVMSASRVRTELDLYLWKRKLSIGQRVLTSSIGGSLEVSSILHCEEWLMIY